MKYVLLTLIALALVSTATFAATEITDVATINNLGYHAYEQGEFELAEKLFDKAIREDTTYEKARFNKAILLNSQERYHEAIDELTMLTTLNANNVQYWYDLGVNYIASFRYNTQDIREFHEGVYAYEQAQKLDANFAYVQENLAVLYNLEEKMYNE